VVLAGLQSELTHVLVTMVWSHPMNHAGIGLACARECHAVISPFMVCKAPLSQTLSALSAGFS